MNKTLNIGLDLGGDTIKIAFAYEHEGNVRYGKFAGISKLTQVALPALAFFDAMNKNWIFGEDVSLHGGESFITVVKIKNLISLLTKHHNLGVMEKNEYYYFHGNDFPKFYFPVRRRMLDNFDLMVKDEMTFQAPGFTPKSVCQTFFNYIKELVDERANELANELNVTFDKYQIALIHPSNVGDEYVDELSSLVYDAFKIKPSKILSSNKALAMYALQRGAVADMEDFLIFDMGEETISVVRAGTYNGQIMIDGVEGHSEAAHIGGIDVDEAIVRKLENSVARRETIGSPSVGASGHISEKGVYGKQYLLMKDIKKAKIIFSKTLKENSRFKNGVPVTLSWDLYIQRVLTKEEVKDCIGVTNGTGIAKKLADYIVEEILRPINHDVKKILISGGLTETYSLLDYIKQEISTRTDNVQVCTFDDFDTNKDGFSILSHEDSVFAPAVGGALVSLKNIKIETIVSLSYGTWAMEENNTLKVLAIFLERGTPIVENMKPHDDFTLGGSGTEKEEIFSTPVTKLDILQSKRKGKNWNISRNNSLIIGEPNSQDRKKAIKDVGLHVVSGGPKGKIRFKYDGLYVHLNEKISILEGMSIDKNGRATPFVRNNDSDRRILIFYSGSKKAEYVCANEIEVVTEGLPGVVIVENN